MEEEKEKKETDAKNFEQGTAFFFPPKALIFLPLFPIFHFRLPQTNSANKSRQ